MAGISVYGGHTSRSQGSPAAWTTVAHASTDASEPFIFQFPATNPRIAAPYFRCRAYGIINAVTSEGERARVLPRSAPGREMLVRLPFGPAAGKTDGTRL